MTLAAIFIRSPVGIRKDIKETLTILHLRRKNVCVILPSTPNYVGMLEKVKDFIAYGELDQETHDLLLKRRGKTRPGAKEKTIFFLHPPRGGYEKKGIKFSYPQGGALGNRKEHINELIRRMQ